MGPERRGNHPLSFNFQRSHQLPFLNYFPTEKIAFSVLFPIKRRSDYPNETFPRLETITVFINGGPLSMTCQGRYKKLHPLQSEAWLMRRPRFLDRDPLWNGHWGLPHLGGGPRISISGWDLLKKICYFFRAVFRGPFLGPSPIGFWAIFDCSLEYLSRLRDGRHAPFCCFVCSQRM